MKKDLTAYVRVDGSGRVVAGSMVLRKHKPKVGRWQQIQTYECCEDLGVLTPFQMDPANAADSGTACGFSNETNIYYHNGVGATPIAGDLIFTDAAGTTPFGGLGSFYHSSSIAGNGVSYEISIGNQVLSVTPCI